MKFFANVYATFIIKITKSFFIIFECFIIIFIVNSIKNVNIEYEFRDWSYTRVQISLASQSKFDYVCLNIESNIVLLNKRFFKTQTLEIFIRKIITLISIRNLDINKHISDEYAIIDMHFSKKNKHEKSILIKITRETYLIDDLKTNIFIENDCIDSKEIVVNEAKYTTHINNCDVIIAVDIRTSRIVIKTSMHTRKTIIISSQFEVIVSVHYIIIFNNRDFLFELIDQLNLTLYAYLIIVDIKIIIISNNKNKIVHLFHNCRVDRMTKVDFLNVFQIKSKIYDLIIKSFKSSLKYKLSWFKKIIATFIAAVTIINAVFATFMSMSQLNIALISIFIVFEMTLS